MGNPSLAYARSSSIPRSLRHIAPHSALEDVPIWPVFSATSLMTCCRGKSGSCHRMTARWGFLSASICSWTKST